MARPSRHGIFGNKDLCSGPCPQGEKGGSFIFDNANSLGLAYLITSSIVSQRSSSKNKPRVYRGLSSIVLSLAIYSIGKPRSNVAICFGFSNFPLTSINSPLIQRLKWAALKWH